jgi:hypothetical protein
LLGSSVTKYKWFAVNLINEIDDSRTEETLQQLINQQYQNIPAENALLAA